MASRSDSKQRTDGVLLFKMRLCSFKHRDFVGQGIVGGFVDRYALFACGKT